MAEAGLQHRKGRSEGCSVLDVARHAKVSAGTVSRVFNGNTSVNPELRERVMRTSRMIGFVPKSRNSVFAVITGRYNPDFSLGQIKDVRGFDRFMRRGFEACRSEWSLVCATHNLLKLWRARWPAGINRKAGFAWL